MLNVVLYEPEIPANTGNIGRTCVVTGSRLHLVGPLGFSLDDHLLRRAGLGYWLSLDLRVYGSWAEFLARNGFETGHLEPRLHLLTKKARRTYAEASHADGDFLVLGRESTGIPEEVLATWPESCERIPMLPDAEALDNAASWGSPAREPGAPSAHAALRAQDVCGNFIDPEDYRISALNLSNAAAVALYEALRQTGFPGM